MSSIALISDSIWPRCELLYRPKTRVPTGTAPLVFSYEIELLRADSSFNTARIRATDSWSVCCSGHRVKFLYVSTGIPSVVTCRYNKRQSAQEWDNRRHSDTTRDKEQGGSHAKGDLHARKKQRARGQTRTKYKRCIRQTIKETL